MAQPADGVLTHVAANLRTHRAAAGISQSELAERSGLSRRTIVSLEAGVANVSLSSLDRLAEPLGITFVDLVRDTTSPAAQINALAWTGAVDGSHATVLGSAPARSEVQLWTWSLGPGDRYDAEPDPPGWHEMILVTTGRLRVQLEHETLVLERGQHAVYSSAQTYSYVNADDDITEFIRNVAR